MNLIKKYLKKALLNSGSVSLAASLAPPGVAVLRYHSIQENPANIADWLSSGIVHSRTTFEEHMGIISQRYQPVSLDDILCFLEGRKKMPKRAVAVTFDDGFVDNFEVAAPVMDKYGVTGTFYITVGAVMSAVNPWFVRLKYAFSTTVVSQWIFNQTGEIFNLVTSDERQRAFIYACRKCGSLSGEHQEKAIAAIEDELGIANQPHKNLMMSREQMRSLRARGHIIGSHTMTHPNIAHVNDAELMEELSESKTILEKMIGEPVTHFSYPSPVLEPHWSRNTIEATRLAGYLTSVTCTPGPVRVGDDTLCLKRIIAPVWRDEFIWYIENTFLGRAL